MKGMVNAEIFVRYKSMGSILVSPLFWGQSHIAQIWLVISTHLRKEKTNDHVAI